MGRVDDRAVCPQIGTSYDVGGRRLNFDVRRGHPGHPTSLEACLIPGTPLPEVTMILGVSLAFAGTLMQTLQPTPAPGVAVTQIVTGRILDATSNVPLAAVRVMLVPVRNGPPAFVPPPRPTTIATEQDGRYTFTGVEPGPYVLNVQKTGYVAPVGPAAPRLEVAAGE